MVERNAGGQQGGRGLDLRPGQPWVPGWLFTDADVHAWPVDVRHSFLWAYSRADWKTGYWQVDLAGLQAYGGLQCAPQLALELWLRAGVVVMVRPGLLRFTTWIQDQHKGVKDWTDWKGVKVFQLISDVEGEDVAKALLPGRHPVALLPGPGGEASPQGEGGSPLPPPQDRHGGVEALPENKGGWTRAQAQGWAAAVLPGVGLLVLKPQAWAYDALALLLTRLGKDRVKGVAAEAAKSPQVGGLEAFLRQVNRFVPVEVVKVCKHDRVAPGLVCLGCNTSPGSQGEPAKPQAPVNPPPAPAEGVTEAAEVSLVDAYKAQLKGAP